jgi:hypothetical protein
MDSMGIKVYLDDLRPCPDGWVYVQTAWDAIKLLKNNDVDEISLDHDLGPHEKVGCGYNVACFIEEQAVAGKKPPITHIHSSNPVGRKNMQMCLDSAWRLYNETLEHNESVEEDQ